jgi:uncharacterized tellurite resistance protein B-like protein
MQTSNDSWTHAHDMAMVFLALVYSTDASLSDEEVDSISKSLRSWRPTASDHEIHEIVLEAASIFFESDAEKEVVQSVMSLGSALSKEQRQQLLKDAMGIAEADGVLLNSELNVLSILASAWDIKATKDRLIEETNVRLESDPQWSVLHDIALMYIIMAHSTDGDLSEIEISTMVDRLSEWEPELDEEKIRSILRTTLEYYGQSPGKADIQDSVKAIKDALPRAQRLVVLDDLVTIARSDGTVKVGEREIVESLSSAWNIDIRIAF